MEVEFTYLIQPATIEQRDALRVAAERTCALNKNLTGFGIGELVTDRFDYLELQEPWFPVQLYSGGHDRSAITRRIVAPIRNLFHRAGIPVASIHLTGTRIMPTGRNLTLDTGRTPKGTFTDPALRQMLADATVD